MSSSKNGSTETVSHRHGLSHWWANGVRHIMSFLRSRAIPSALVVVIALLLIVVHGFKDSGFTIDHITLGLLVFAALPLLAQIVTSFKAGNVEVNFRDLSVHDQVFKFLDGIATKRQWTFFSPRPGEESLGPAFVVLTEQLLTNCRQRLINELRTWLSSDDVNQRWFAAEIVGYHRITELRRALKRAQETEDRNEPWPTWELNCLWAESRFDEKPYERLKSFLSRTSNRTNQIWILRAFDQMIEAKQDAPHIFVDAVSDFALRLRRDEVPVEERLSLVEGLPSIRPIFLQQNGG